MLRQLTGRCGSFRAAARHQPWPTDGAGLVCAAASVMMLTAGAEHDLNTPALADVLGQDAPHLS